MKKPIIASEYQPPMRNGVTASKVFIESTNQKYQTTFEYLCEHFPHIEKNEWQQRFEDGLILNIQGQTLSVASALQSNTHLYYYRFLKHEIHVPFLEKIIFENNDLLVVDKPHFLTISPTGKYVQETLLVRLKKSTGNEQLTPIHRLDRETAGIVLFSKNKDTRGVYQQMFAEREVKKIYHAIAAYNSNLTFPCQLNLRMEKGHPFYTMQVVAGDANSSTDIEILERNQSRTKYLLKPLTGKQHQLRVHLNYLNIPIKNDPFYPTVIHKDDDDFSQPLQLLAKQIEFLDPLTKQIMCFCSEYELTL